MRVTTWWGRAMLSAGLLVVLSVTWLISIWFLQYFIVFGVIGWALALMGRRSWGGLVEAARGGDMAADKRLAKNPTPPELSTLALVHAAAVAAPVGLSVMTDRFAGTSAWVVGIAAVVLVASAEALGEYPDVVLAKGFAVLAVATLAIVALSSGWSDEVGVVPVWVFAASCGAFAVWMLGWRPSAQIWHFEDAQSDER